MGGGAVGPDNGPGAGGTAFERMAARAEEAKNGGPRDSRCPKGAGEEGGGNAAARGARPRGREGASRGFGARSRARVRGRAAPPSPPPQKVFPKLFLHRRGSSRIVIFRTGA